MEEDARAQQKSSTYPKVVPYICCNSSFRRSAIFLRLLPHWFNRSLSFYNSFLPLGAFSVMNENLIDEVERQDLTILPEGHLWIVCQIRNLAVKGDEMTFEYYNKVYGATLEEAIVAWIEEHG